MCFHGSLQGVALQRKSCSQCERPLARQNDFAHPAPYPRPDPFSSLPVLLADDLGQVITAGNAMQKPKRIADVALARGIRPDQDGERPELRARRP